MDHHDQHSPTMSGRSIPFAIGLSLAFVAAEGFIGWRTGSLALVSDAGHNFTDAIALALAAFAIRMARKPATATRTFGYHRVAILIALTNALSLVAISLVIFREAIARIQRPEVVDSGWMIGTALAALAMNVWISMRLHAGSRHDLNIRGAYVHMVGDALASAGVVLAGIIVWSTGYVIADPIISIVLSALILWSSVGILRESLDILLEAAPRGMDLAEVGRTVCGVPGVVGCHDLHVWTISSGILAASCHAVVTESSAAGGQRIAHAVSAVLADAHGIAHATVQVEVEACADADRPCSMSRLDAPAARPAASGS
jgi:cobalt-zinc-cadmium efflux system protein